MTRQCASRVTVRLFTYVLFHQPASLQWSETKRHRCKTHRKEREKEKEKDRKQAAPSRSDSFLVSYLDRGDSVQTNARMYMPAMISLSAPGSGGLGVEKQACRSRNTDPETPPHQCRARAPLWTYYSKKQTYSATAHPENYFFCAN